MLTKDHLGNSFKSIKAMCDFYNIPLKEYNSLRYKGYSVKDILEGTTEEVIFYDNLGNPFVDLSGVARYHNVSLTELRKLVKEGNTVTQSLDLLKNYEKRQEEVVVPSNYQFLEEFSEYGSDLKLVNSKDTRYFNLAKHIARAESFSLREIQSKEYTVVYLLECILGSQDSSYLGEKENIRKSLEFFKRVNPDVLNYFYSAVVEGIPTSKYRSVLGKVHIQVATDVSYFIDMLRRIVYCYMINDLNSNKRLPESLVGYVVASLRPKVSVCDYSNLNARNSLNFINLSGCLFLSNKSKSKSKNTSGVYPLVSNTRHKNVLALSRKSTEHGVALVCDITNTPVQHPRYRTEWLKYVAEIYGVRLNPLVYQNKNTEV